MSQPVATSNDNAGGRLQPSVVNVFVTGAPIIVLNDKVTPHGPFGGHLSGPRIVTSSQTVFANGKPVTRLGDNANCGHRVEVGQKMVFAS